MFRTHSWDINQALPSLKIRNMGGALISKNLEMDLT